MSPAAAAAAAAANALSPSTVPAVAMSNAESGLSIPLLVDSNDARSNPVVHHRPVVPTRLPTLVTALSYRGMEVFFATSTVGGSRGSGSAQPRTQVTGVFSRTHCPFQTLDLPSESISAGVAAIESNATTGMICVATGDGLIHTYYPVETAPAHGAPGGVGMSVPTSIAGHDPGGASSDETRPATAFGKYRWITSRAVDCTEVFALEKDRKDEVKFDRRRKKEASGNLHSDRSRFVIISTSLDWKILVSHGDQLAVFDVTPVDLVHGPVPGLDYGGANPPRSAAFGISKGSTPPVSPRLPSMILSPPPGALLWTSRAQHDIVSASMSGDGRAIAYVIKGEHITGPLPYGTRIFIRDEDDGATGVLQAGNSVSTVGRKKPSKRDRSKSLEHSNSGIVYKPGPLLKHSAPVTRVRFRGLGSNHAASSFDSLSMSDIGDEGNDLLLTSSQSDNCCRVFCQSSWQQLLQWTTPPKSRADWVQGITAGNLGDLDVAPARKKGTSGGINGSRPGSAQISRRPSFSAASSEVGDAGINRHLLGHDRHQPFESFPSNPAPTSSAGAWISELTFRGGFPALRLSRLSYLKSGTDNATPAHFESVAAILPPGTLSADAVLQEECGCDEDHVMSVQGIWCAWDPWEYGHGGGGGNLSGEDLAGSALNLLGGALTSAFGETSPTGTGKLGGSHAPPSELRIIACHIGSGEAVVMEFPLWGDKELGAMELGSPLRYLLSLPGSEGHRYKEAKRETKQEVSKPACSWLDFESSQLCATVSEDKESIKLTWRKKGTMNIVPITPSSYFSPRRGEEIRPSELIRVGSLESIASTASMDSDLSNTSFQTDPVLDFDTGEGREGPRYYRDYSMVPLPLLLPPLLLPPSSSLESSPDEKDRIEAVQWWPNENFGGPPRLLAITKLGAIVVYDMPPPWSALQPPMPVDNPFDVSGESSIESEIQAAESPDCSDIDDASAREEYEVDLKPDVDFGIGLRLESQARGMPALAGSFKKHPLNGGRLPAEKNGQITLGDELLSVNGVRLEGKTFDEVIATIQNISTETMGGILKMRFRPAVQSWTANNIIRSNASGISSSFGADPRRGVFATASMEEDDVKNIALENKGFSKHPGAAVDKGNARSVLRGAEEEVQQQFGRIVAFIRDAVSPLTRSLSCCPVVLLSSMDGVIESLGPALSESVTVITAEGNELIASRLEVADSGNPEEATFHKMGSVYLNERAATNETSMHIESITVVKSTSAGWSVAVCDSLGSVSLVFIDIEGAQNTPTDSSQKISATFRKYNILSFSKGGGVDVRASSIDLIATMPKHGSRNEVTVWSAIPYCDPDDSNCENYAATKVCHGGSGSEDEQLLDFRLVSSGSMDAFPWLVTFSCHSAVVHRRPGGQLGWMPVAELSYSPIMKSSDPLKLSGPPASIVVNDNAADINQTKALPHVLSALRIIVTASDERVFLKSDWHPDSILASVCTDERGAKLALKHHVQSLFKWLSLWMSPDGAARPVLNSRLPLSISPYYVINDEDMTDGDMGGASDVDHDNENAAALFSTTSISVRLDSNASKAKSLMSKLQSALSRGPPSGRSRNSKKKNKHSKEFKVAMGFGTPGSDHNIDHDPGGIELPEPLQNLSGDEILVLWAMGEVIAKPPKFASLDLYAEHTSFCMALFRNIESANVNNSDEREADYTQSSLRKSSPISGRSFLVKRSSLSLKKDSVKFSTIASSAFLSALVSDTQRKLLSSARRANKKMDWPTARTFGIPFWLRSDEELRKVAEEIAQDIFQKKRDVMESALFFIATRNMRSLQSFAYADQTETGKMFSKFLTQYDFSSPRGRKAAEKNAYSLLRKRRYGVAAGFFLLTEPPMLKSALEVIVNQMEDLALAFMISRLIESSSTSPPVASLSSMGGGGGFAGTSFAPASEMPPDDVTFHKWCPQIGEGARNLLTLRGLLMVSDDPFLEAVQHLWLGHQSEAGMCLARLPVSSVDVVVPPVFDVATSAKTAAKYACVNDRIIAKVNKIINFTSAPLLLKRMKTSQRVRWASALLVSRALQRRGIELPSMRTLLQTTEDNDYVPSFSVGEERETPSSEILSASATKDGIPQSSMFEFVGAAQKPKLPAPHESASEEMSSSIFDSFDAAPQKLKPKAPAPASAPTPAPAPAPSPGPKAPAFQLELPLPPLWKEWRGQLLASSVARRLLREVARAAASFEGEVIVPPMKLFCRHVHPLITRESSHVLQYHCQADAILSGINEYLQEMIGTYKVERDAVIGQALIIIACPEQPRRIVFAFLLYCLMGRSDLAEDVVRSAAQDQIHKCQSFAYANDDLIFKRKTRHHVSSQYLRRQASSVSLQLELCLWLHHGGFSRMCGMAVKEAIIAVRVGYLVAGWGRCHESLETMLKNEPDCAMDHDAGRQVWSSMKIISSFDEKLGKNSSSGGWEFLVDCKRQEAAALLKDTKPGTFLIRPHAEDHGVFTLSFRTNLTPTEDKEEVIGDDGNEVDGDGTEHTAPKQASDSADVKISAQRVKKEDVVQHAIVRLSEGGFRCGSFGPFASLIELLEAVSSSLPFKLRLDQPPVQAVINDTSSAPSPNSFFIRKLALHSKTSNYQWNSKTQTDSPSEDNEITSEDRDSNVIQSGTNTFALKKSLGGFSQLLALTETRKQLSAIAAADIEDRLVAKESWAYGIKEEFTQDEVLADHDDFQEGLSHDSSFDIGEEESYAIAERMLRPLLCWCRSMETAIVHELAPNLQHIWMGQSPRIDVDASETEIEVGPSSGVYSGDTEIRRMIQPESGVEFRTLRVGDANNSSIVVLFSRKEAISWLQSSGAEKDEPDAVTRLEKMERRRVIEQIDLNELDPGRNYSTEASPEETDIRYRFVDPWEVEVVESREGEVASATIGRGRYLTFSVGRVAKACEQTQRSLGGLHLLALWSLAKGGICLTKALASVHSPWERDAGGNLRRKDGLVAEPAPFDNIIRQHLYRNMLFRRLDIPQRFLALLQVELLDLKNLTAPSGTSSLTAYALVRLKRPGSGAPLTHKARTLDSACTQPQKIVTISGPNAPASWGTLVRLRFPLPEDVDCNGVSYDGNRELLFKGAPSVLQLSVYEKKFMKDVPLGGADVRLDALTNDGQLEEWVPLKSEKDGVVWFARIRMTLRFELMCLVDDEIGSKVDSSDERCPSVALQKIRALSKSGGAHEEAKGVKRSASTPDFWDTLESMVS